MMANDHRHREGAEACSLWNRKRYFVDSFSFLSTDSKELANLFASLIHYYFILIGGVI